MSFITPGVFSVQNKINLAAGKGGNYKKEKKRKGGVAITLELSLAEQCKLFSVRI